MKKLLFIVVTSIILSTSSFASIRNGMSNEIANSFATKFKGAGAVQWSIKSGYNTATFIEAGTRTQAFFDVDGTLVATCKAVGFDVLPENARYRFEQRYQAYAIKEIISYEDQNQFAYYISLENNVEKVILKVSGSYLSVFSKVAK